MQGEKTKKREDLERDAKMARAKAASEKKQQAQGQDGLTSSAPSAQLPKKKAAPPPAALDVNNADYYKNVQEDLQKILKVMGSDFGRKVAVQIAAKDKDGDGGVQDGFLVVKTVAWVVISCFAMINMMPVACTFRQRRSHTTRRCVSVRWATRASMLRQAICCGWTC